MSNLSERLAELISDTHKDIKVVAQEVGLPASCFTQYIKGQRLPTVESLVKIADYFGCSTDYLLGYKEEYEKLKFKPCPPFCERLQFLKEHSKCNSRVLYESAGVSKSGYFEWKRGRHQPSLENVIKIAKYLGESVDFILGRES